MRYTLQMPGHPDVQLHSYGEVLARLNDHDVPAAQRTGATLLRDGRPFGPLLKDAYGKFGVDLVVANGWTGLAAEDLREQQKQAMISFVDEVTPFVVPERGATPLQPWQMSSARWDAVHSIGSLAHNVYPGLRARIPYEFADLVGQQMHERFGYGHNGPPYNSDRVTNSRHEVQVAYALLHGKPVPDDVIAEYEHRVGGNYTDLRWMGELIAKPWLRGRFTEDQFGPLVHLLHADKVEIREEMVSDLQAILRGINGPVTYVSVDDALYRAGVLPPHPAPGLKVVDWSGASPLELELRDEIAQLRAAAQRTSLEARRARGEVSLRRMEHEQAINARVRETTERKWPSEVARAIQARDVTMLLDMLDCPDDRNSATKRVIQRQFPGVKLLGLKSVERTRAIFAFCGLDEAAQKRYEAQAAVRREERLRAQDDERIREAVEGLMWDVGDGRRVPAREQIDKLVAEGFTEIIKRRPGVKVSELLLHKPGGTLAYRLSSKDGTLDYARLAIREASQRAEQVAAQGVTSEAQTDDGVEMEEAQRPRAERLAG